MNTEVNKCVMDGNQKYTVYVGVYTDNFLPQYIQMCNCMGSSSNLSQEIIS